MGLVVLVIGVGTEVLTYFGIAPSSFIPYEGYLVGTALGGVILIAFFLYVRKFGDELLRRYETELKNQTQLQTPKKQGFAFFDSRADLPDLRGVLLSEKKEIIAVGGTLEIAKQRADIFDEILKKDEPRVRIHLLLMDEESPFITALEEAHGQGGIRTNIRGTLEVLCSVRKGLTDLQRERLDIRTYKLVPLHSLLIIDRETIRIEPYIYNIKGAGSRPSFEYSKTIHPIEFDRYWKGYEHILSDSSEYRCPSFFTMRGASSSS